MAPGLIPSAPVAAPVLPPGRYGWCWRDTLAALQGAGATITWPGDDAASAISPPEFVVAAAAHAVVATRPPPRDLTWLLTDVADLAACTERHLAACTRILSPLTPGELRWPAALPAAARAAAREKIHFLEVAPPAAAERTPAFVLTHLAVTEPFPTVVWQAVWRTAAPDSLDELQLQQAIVAAGAPAGCWLLPPPLATLDLGLLERLAPAGTHLIPCANFRAGAQEAIRRRAAPRPAAPARTRTVLELAPGVTIRCVAPTVAEMDTLFPPVATRGARPDFAQALADWQAGRASIVALAHAFVDSGRWRQPGAPAALRAKLLAESTATPAAFFGNALGRLPLPELYDTPTERTIAIARFGRELLGEAPGDTGLRRLAHALLGDLPAFQAAAPVGELGPWLAAVAIAWLTRLAWQPGALPALPASAPVLPGELLLGAAAALATQDRTDDALALARLATRTHPELFERSRNEGRWNRHLLWALLCRRWGDESQAEAALDWARATDATLPEQLFLLARPAPRVSPGTGPLPVCSAPWRGDNAGASST